MSVNKFGMSLTNRSNGDGIDGESAVRLRSSIESLRNYTRDNALFASDDSYDARERKIRRVAAPEDGDDAANKSYVDIWIAYAKFDVAKDLKGEITSVRNDALLSNLGHYEARWRMIRHVAAPDVDTDAANKIYVDGAIARLENKVTEGIKRSDALRLNGDFYDAGERRVRRVAEPVAGTDAATKVYVDGAIGRLRTVVTEEAKKNDATEELRGEIGTLRNGALLAHENLYDAGERRIRRVAAPEDGADAANRSFVEGAIAEAKKNFKDLIREFRRQFLDMKKTVDKHDAEIGNIRSIVNLLKQ